MSRPKHVAQLLLRIAVLAGASWPFALPAQEGRLRPQGSPGDPPAAHVFFESGFTIRVIERDGGLVVGSASMIPSTEEGPPPLRGEDRLVHVDGVALTTLESFERHLDALRVGDPLRLTVQRGDLELSVAHSVTTIQRLLAEGRMHMGLGGETSAVPTGGSWTAASQPASAPPVVIAGSRIRSDDTGALVVDFRSRHPSAAAVDLRIGDQILSMNERRLGGLAELRALYETAAAGDPVVLRVLREGSPVELRFAKPAGP